MVFSSIGFLFFFLPALLIVYYIVPRRYREVRNFVLLGFSLFFYAYGGPRFLILMLVSIAINYVCGLFVAEGHSDKTRRFFLVAAVVLGLGLLGWFKYSRFFAESLNALGTGLPVPDVTLPIGISFFTFHGLSYIIDVYRGTAKPMKNPLRIALYISLFPQLVAGPIVRYATVSDKLGQRHENLTDFSEGAMRFVFGLAKKMLLANTLGIIADKAFGTEAGALSTSFSWLGALAYTGQIYFDFSAYSDMALGLGRMFGFHFLENFNYPYIAKSVTEFWQRWHISLTSWFRDYVYIPLGGNRCSRLKNIRNIVIVWFLTGFWHGAAWNFIFWGLWFCVLLLGEKFVWGKRLAKAPAALRHIYTMLIVVLSWVLFRAESLPQVVSYLGAMFGLGVTGAADGQTLYLLKEYWPELIVSVIAVTPVKNTLRSFLEKHRAPVSRQLLLWGPRLLGLVLLAFSYLKLVVGSFNPFIYFRF
ncbi:alginate O-acetyltransferase complex protein AlgI [Sporobacter termitidis DSM 10068]|uniref:Alginate O-acetyltransferase complex protein AlgI n=1 Tax=Sporobacter termitidis DSM 10068 TaxID=1123282 RepID=A0A1M5Z9K4_9FIRM|nr:MBOAT family O-acyltransferase [Sporobacter termitidis]SHI20904.1 alginate O-acetyltransferase complex protein AlgI [Sporobacter termitidis DSM 10068]